MIERSHTSTIPLHGNGKHHISAQQTSALRGCYEYHHNTKEVKKHDHDRLTNMMVSSGCRPQ
jgi:hypothetical protein